MFNLISIGKFATYNLRIIHNSQYTPYEIIYYHRFHIENISYRIFNRTAEFLKLFF